MSVLDHALAAADQGLLVFPLRPLAKIPAHKGWREEATTDPNAINQWFNERKNLNYGIRTGSINNLYVVDLDGPEAQRWWRSTGFADGAIVSTPSGPDRTHHYFQIDTETELPSTRSKLAQHVDTRGESGLVPGPGSMLPTGTYLGDIRKIPMIPEGLLAILPEKQIYSTEEFVGEQVEAATDSERRQIASAIEALEVLPRVWVEGAGWRSEMYRVACWLNRMANSPAYAMTREAALSVIIEHTPTDSEWGLPQIMEQWESAKKSTIGQFASAPAEAAFRLAGQSGTVQRATSGEPAIATGGATVELAAPHADEPTYVDVGALLDGNLQSPKPTLGVRSDGQPFIYPAAVNIIFGPPETGKTLALSAIAADVLFSGGSALWIDIDHNGDEATIARFRSFGVPAKVLRDRARFRLATPEDKDEVLRVVKDSSVWKPTLVALDSVGELLPMFGANSNSDDEYTAVHRAVLSKMSTAGRAVVGIDHEAKGQASRNFGAGGAVAKKRAVDGVLLRASVRIPFTPGSGGKAVLTIVKDRHGGVRSISQRSGDREPIAATFELISDAATSWKFWAPNGAWSSPSGTLIDQINALRPPPKSQRDVRSRMGLGSVNAKKVYDAFLAQAA